MTDARQFTLELQHEADKLLHQIDATQRGLARQAVMRLARLTPVRSGRARASWNISRGVPDDTVPPEGTYTEAALLDKLGRLQPSPQNLTDIHVSSNLGYIAHLEDGSSQQAPAGMLKLVHAELEAIQVQL